MQAYKQRMGWSFPWASSYGSDFNYDFQVGHTKQEWDAGTVEYNFREVDMRAPAGEESSRDAWAGAIVGTDWETYRREGPGHERVRARGRRRLPHLLGVRARTGRVWGMYQWLDRAPLGRNETGLWWRRHDEYDSQ